ncbi:helix-turn-helix domain-containing protein [Castellaniella hirudinis]|uniref:helix-turn-helix domain-containing protein n=1 Tax=Castellaniella hirudinis TaxID=1144617 RepID=UPI0039C0AE27
MIGMRLREERERLGYAQPAFAEIAGSKKRTLIDWEKGVSSPTAVQLAELAKVGVDVLYVLTGKRSNRATSHDLDSDKQPTPNPSLTTGLPTQAAPRPLSRDEEMLLDNYRHTSPDRRRFIRDAAFVASQRDVAQGGRKR